VVVNPESKKFTDKDLKNPCSKDVNLYVKYVVPSEEDDVSVEIEVSSLEGDFIQETTTFICKCPVDMFKQCAAHNVNPFDEANGLMEFDERSSNLVHVSCPDGFRKDLHEKFHKVYTPDCRGCYTCFTRDDDCVACDGDGCTYGCDCHQVYKDGCITPMQLGCCIMKAWYDSSPMVPCVNPTTCCLTARGLSGASFDALETVARELFRTVVCRDCGLMFVNFPGEDSCTCHHRETFLGPKFAAKLD
jgi:hypothetical protein